MTNEEHAREQESIELGILRRKLPADSSMLELAEGIARLTPLERAYLQRIADELASFFDGLVEIPCGHEAFTPCGCRLRYMSRRELLGEDVLS